ncbi:hypothetical protein [Streptomyces bluensis]|uniref:hypothetical protein n=1 Tax=Streptomyces bluensis TaxID=33897 RepID=UPI001677ADE7|nr:hypothetical protein [Streptomyces bluensis]GGZ72338.1 hypothetical protein GCM10010344_44240 [Streptomyces bluensis]
MFKRTTTLAVATLLAGLGVAPVAEAAQTHSLAASSVTLYSKADGQGNSVSYAQPGDVPLVQFTAKSAKNTTNREVRLWSQVTAAGKCGGTYRSVPADGRIKNLDPAKTVRCIQF